MKVSPCKCFVVLRSGIDRVITPLCTCAVLPRFEVTLEGPKQLTQEDNFITGRAVAE